MFPPDLSRVRHGIQAHPRCRANADIFRPPARFVVEQRNPTADGMSQETAMDRERLTTHPLSLLAVSGPNADERDDVVAIEEPLELLIGYGATEARREKSLSITMRTPGNDAELAVGFLLAELVISSREDVVDVVAADSGDSNVVRVDLRPRVAIDEMRLHRDFLANSSCGVCGRAILESLNMSGMPTLPLGGLVVRAEAIVGLQGKLRGAQSVFESTGGVHAAGLFSPDGGLLLVREDIGRHNAVDKVVGSQVIAGASCRETILAVSGRVSFEVVQKALAAGIPVLVSVGAPSSLAVTIADEFGMTLVGFARGERFNVYTGSHRVLLPKSERIGKV